MEDKNKYRVMNVFIAFMFLACCFMFYIIMMPGVYINKPFGGCDKNYTENYGSFQSCGELMSKDTAKIGLWSILLGLPGITFFLFIINSMKKQEESEVKS